MTDDQHIRRRGDGSIDTSHYLAVGLNHRSAAARQLMAHGCCRLRVLMDGLAGYRGLRRLLRRDRAGRPGGAA